MTSVVHLGNIQDMNTMRLSVCVIVGQDAEKLPRMLDSVAGIADELIIVSTAGSDKVRNIGRAFGARIREISWPEDFAAVRNAGFSMARSSWILSLDADEWLDQTSHSELASCLESPGVLAWLATIVDRSGINGTPRFSPAPLPRIFHPRPELRLAGRVHEHFEPDLHVTARRLGLEVRSSTINIFHDGYNPDREGGKLRRNIHLMELELRDRPGQLFYQIRISQALLKIDDPRACHFLCQAWEQIRPPSAHGSRPSEPLVAELLDSIIVRQSRGEFDSGETIAKLLELAQTWYPHWPPLIWRRANWQFKQGQVAEAAQSLEEILQLAADGTYQRIPSFDCGILTGETQLNLGICYARLRQFDRARRCFSAAATDPKWEAAGQRNLQFISADVPA